MSQPAKNIQASQFPYQRFVITGRINVPRALHVGMGQASLLTDAAIRRDGDGQPYIPGSTLAGLLRSAAKSFAQYICTDAGAAIQRLFGHAREDDSRRKTFSASCLLVEDARICESVPVDIEIRDYVGIDRRRAAARPHLKYDREVAPSNTSYAFELSLEEPNAEDARLLLTVLDFWSEYGVQIGARTTTGLGEARIDKGSLKFYGLNFRDDDVLKDFLLAGGIDAKHVPASVEIERAALEPEFDKLNIQPSDTAPLDEPFCPQYLFVTLDLILEEPLLIKGSIPEVPDLPDETNQTGEASPSENNSSSPSERTSDAEFITALGLEEGFYIPGSSLKGVLRTRAEKIIRTLNFYRPYTDLTTAEADPDSERHYETRIAACAVTHSQDSSPRMMACFGDKGRQKTAKEYDHDNRRKRRAERAKDKYERSCVTCRVFGNSIMRGRLTCTEAIPKTTLTPKLFDHVAIDRFTGGAADTKKFDTRPLMPVIVADRAIEAFTFHIHIERAELWMLGLLGHLLKDLNSGDIRIGHATRRGYGRVRACVAEATFLALPDTQLFSACRRADLSVEKKFPTYGPYLEVNLSDDWKNIFSETSSGANGPDQPVRDTPGGKLLTEADRAFQEYVAEAEQHSETENFGEFHEYADHTDR